MLVSESLRAARALIDTPEKWWKGWLENHGRLCTIGAGKVALGLDLRGNLSEQMDLTPLGPMLCALVRAAGLDSIYRLASWNDSRNHAEVMAAFDRAIANAEAIEQEHRMGDEVGPAPVLNDARPVLV